jgi:hypothetical protein
MPSVGLWYDFALKAPLSNGCYVTKIFLSQVKTFSLFFIILLFNGCTTVKKTEPAPLPLPQITTAYLLAHRIISYEPKYQETIIATLPYEIINFDESFQLNLVARIPDENRSPVFVTTGPRYYLWLERKAQSWLDFTEVHSVMIAPLKINAHFSAIRKGVFYKEYTIDFTIEQLEQVQDSGLDLLLINENSNTSEIALPSYYIKAFLKMLETYSDPK